ncbi:BlaI/MecI/CopY family transcriptional regulator [Nocardioides sp. TF02-7]|uniref:BlaI/MecI/CopY family transcriptional regulator n=1 Tax=Nocardioides sp. TF02-7 TaxID=2917724 RepID=UPI001F059583|nr:BlaI/MecI/CopY family transcriptional regulator [Nocardioides sp. TF02-7]UMG92237.1 BlaI/MecI/CopY family transcriptional regulator [Nocardioides sp. TF02-7]
MKGLGELEAQVMNLLWATDAPQSVRQVLEALPHERNRAYTTVMTVLDNLHRKGFVERERLGRAWNYRPTRSREEHVADLMGDALGASGDRTAALMHFVEQLPAEEAAQLRALLDRHPE